MRKPSEMEGFFIWFGGAVWLASELHFVSAFPLWASLASFVGSFRAPVAAPVYNYNIVHQVHYCK